MLTSGIVLQNESGSRFLHLEVGNVGTVTRTLTVQVVHWGSPPFGSPAGPVGNFLAPVTNVYAPNTARQFNVIIPFNAHYEVRLIAADAIDVRTGTVITSSLATSAGTGWIEGHTQFVNDYKFVSPPPAPMMTETSSASETSNEKAPGSA